MNYPFPPFPTLASEHLTGAKLFASRGELIPALPIARNGVIAEVGVMRGDFSAFLMDTLTPQKFVAFDLYVSHTWPSVWDIPSAEFFDGMTHIDYFRKKMAPYGSRIVIEEGFSNETMPKHANQSFDMVYIDAGHSYEDVKSDADWAAKMVKDSGVLVFNDYIMFDHVANIYYGIVPVVNDMVVNQGWHVLGFSFHHDMFCDIAIQRKKYAVPKP